MNIPVDSMKEVDMDPMEVSLRPKLNNEHLELIAELTHGVSVLMDGLNACDDVGFAVGGLVVFLEGFNEFVKGWERFDIFVCVDIPHLGFSTEHGSSKTSLELSRDLREVDILLYAESPGRSGGKREVGTVESIRFRDPDLLGHVS